MPDVTEVHEAWPQSLDASNFEALLFDLDGTLVDTMQLHGRAYADVFAARGFHLGIPDYLAHVGPPAAIALPLFMAAAGMREITEELTREIHREKKIRFKEVVSAGAVPTLAAAQLLTRFKGVKPMAIVSSGNRDGVEAIIAALGWTKCFDAVVTGDDVTRGKPDPEPFLRAAALLGVMPALCLALEDTEAGLTSARSAGMAVIDVTGSGAVTPARPAL